MLIKNWAGYTHFGASGFKLVAVVVGVVAVVVVVVGGGGGGVNTMVSISVIYFLKGIKMHRLKQSGELFNVFLILFSSQDQHQPVKIYNGYFQWCY